MCFFFFLCIVTLCQPAELKTPSSSVFVALDEQGYCMKLSSCGRKQLPDASCLYQKGHFFFFLHCCLVRLWLLPGIKISKENKASEHLTQTSGRLSVVCFLLGAMVTLTPKKSKHSFFELFFFDSLVCLTRVDCLAKEKTAATSITSVNGTK